MPADPFAIDMTSVFDNIDQRQVEFDATVDGDAYQFAVQYDVIEALSGEVPNGDAALRFGQHVDAIRKAAKSALSRGFDRPIVVISGNDLA